MGLLITLIIGGIIGWLASKFMHSDAEMGWVANVIAGIVGAWLGNALFGGVFGAGTPIYAGVTIESVIVSIVGACLVIFLWQLATGRRNI